MASALDADRFAGTLFGLAVCDALGTTVEFEPPGSFTPVTDMVGGGPFDLLPGQWTDDTSMALCLAESLVVCAGFDPADQMRRYLRWYRDGHLSSTGRCFDIGNTTRGALMRFEVDGKPFAGRTDPQSAGNGSLMRLAPMPMVWAHDVTEAVRLAGDMSRTTHGAREAVDACRYYTALIVGALHGADRQTLLAQRYEPVPALWDAAPLAPRVDAVACGSFLNREPPQIRGSGYVVETLEAALWAFHRSDSFASGALAAVNLGDDADTTGAIYGQLAGAYYGLSGIPEYWLAPLAKRSVIDRLCEQLLGLSQRLATRAVQG